MSGFLKTKQANPKPLNFGITQTFSKSAKTAMIIITAAFIAGNTGCANRKNLNMRQPVATSNVDTQTDRNRQREALQREKEAEQRKREALQRQQEALQREKEAEQRQREALQREKEALQRQQEE